jgi:putative DNA primase/helicase
MRRDLPLDFAGANQIAAANVMNLLQHLLPDGRLEGREWVARNPHREDQSLGSFKINTATGKWSDFATTDRGGDLVSLVAYVLRLRQGAAADKITKKYGRSFHGKN